MPNAGVDGGRLDVMPTVLALRRAAFGVVNPDSTLLLANARLELVLKDFIALIRPLGRERDPLLAQTPALVLSMQKEDGWAR